VTQKTKLILTPSQKKKAQSSLSQLRKVFSDHGDPTLEEMVELLAVAELTKEISVSTDFSLPRLGQAFSYYAFSDGACRGNPGPGAWGALIQDREGLVVYEGSSVEVNTTNNRMELQGALEALKFILEEFGANDPIALVSDSKYVVEGLKSWAAGWKRRGWKKADGKTPENVFQWQELDEVASEFKEIQYFWVKGHSGHPQNEKCDQLANEALDDSGF